MGLTLIDGVYAPVFSIEVEIALTPVIEIDGVVGFTDIVVEIIL